jgi:hypothetical protein
MTLEDKDILQVDATVITGILILLTFSLIGPSSDDPTLVDIEVELTIRLALTVFMLMPFVIFAIIILLKKDEKDDDRISHRQTRIAGQITAIGFGLILFDLFFFFIAVYL